FERTPLAFRNVSQQGMEFRGVWPLAQYGGALHFFLDIPAAQGSCLAGERFLGTHSYIRAMTA
ncbi:hypothetical protein, partial [Salmonella enterica]|uniref:hypothetical protein n=1 Tax=Salmonella enterica TaxID=28901 RepID=UPI003CFABBC9